MTIVEVVASLALLATLLTAVLLAKARYTRQWVLAQKRIEAVAAADQLLTDWWTSSKIPRGNSTGSLPNPAMSWRLHSIRPRDLAEIDMEILRLEIVDRTTGKIMTSVDLLSNSPSPRGANAKAGT